ncbi:MAG: putative F420-0 ABC transporter substrate-binding protein [Chloroflexi bacterium]|nr:MAG: putative F420-0 ABC transporter substrate-binding protein [Chloroflexota bacterium]
MKKTTYFYTLLLLLAALLVACGGATTEEPDAPAPEEEAAPAAIVVEEAEEEAAPTATVVEEAEEEAAPTATVVEEAEEVVEEEVAEESMAGFPVTIDNCGLSITYDAPPEHAVTMNQAATELMLALGLEDKMVGTAYIDDEILPEYADAYASVPVLSDKYPSQEVLFASEPDFVYGVYRSAFGDEAAGSREELNGLGIGSYLSEVACEDEALRPDKATFDTVYDEIRNIGLIFGVEDRAEALIADMEAQLDASLVMMADQEVPTRIFWYDSGDDEPFVGACCGTPGMIIDALGAENIFADAEGNWATVSWEEVVERNPDAIVIIEADWSPAQDKIDLLLNDPLFETVTAVKEQNFVVIPFSATTLGVRNVQAVTDLATGLGTMSTESE